MRPPVERHAGLGNPWNTYVHGSGALERVDGELLVVTTGSTRRRMTVAQIDDYQRLPRRQYRWRPPLTMCVRARFSHPARQLVGTAGFGFWNDPFMMTGRTWPALPRALWFFYASPPSNIALDRDVPGCGWKAATIDAARPRALRWAPLAPLLVPLMNLRAIYQALWPRIQRDLGICEASLDLDMTAWHDYRLDWDPDAVRFVVDGQTAAVCAAPCGPLGFVLWLDNQYLVITPWGRLRYGWLDAPGRQWMQVAQLSIAPVR
ncbi:MAG: hypothetical protein JXA09_18150 [Anaerolineae bacterium]|nr:hypothetical protein [Anaerolineae bacterium]